MSNLSRAVCISSALALSLCGGIGAQERAAESEGGTGQVEWLADIKAGEKAAARTGKPLLLVFR